VLRPAPTPRAPIARRLPQRSAGREYVDGATAIVRGALEAGADFFAGYPITPASPILTQALRALPTRGGVAIQAEDEIASVSMCLEAVLGGACAFTATSGWSMSRYRESAGLALMGEVPLVVVDVQRLGRASDEATTTGRGDAGGRAGHSAGFPMIALSPSTVAECRTITMRAFDLAERFRCPVFVLADRELALSTRSVPLADLEEPVTVRPRSACGSAAADRRPYRYLDLEGKITAHAQETAFVAADLQGGARTLLVSYGVSAAAMREAALLCRQDGGRVSTLTLFTLWPVPEAAIARALMGIERIVVAELDRGDYRREVERVAGARTRVVGVTRTDGERITPGAIREAIL
jgi:2-oxoglutarate ferredoxin oxidoreductase subunit alpha